MRSLNPDEAELWARVAATIRPLSREFPDDPPPPPTSAKPPPSPTLKQTRPVARRPAPASAPAPAKPVPGETLDGSWDRRLRDGAVQPDRTLDLHGMTMDMAWSAIDTGLDRAIARGDRVILLITGHHRPGEPPVQRGKIRAAVHDWLAASRHAGQIAAVRGAHRRHGGGGSLYLILRRSREGSR
ncbi:MAG: Smr/MutS family protein [Sphingomicrobium sp.]